MSRSPARGKVILAACFHDPIQNPPVGVLPADGLEPAVRGHDCAAPESEAVVPCWLTHQESLTT